MKNEEFYVKPCPFEKDELVEVSHDGDVWSLRHFSHIDETVVNGKYRAFAWGSNSKITDCTHGWDFCRKYGTLGGLMEGARMDKNEFILWLYEQKDEIDKKLHRDHCEGSYRTECWAKVNLLDTIIEKAKKELK